LLGKYPLGLEAHAVWPGCGLRGEKFGEILEAGERLGAARDSALHVCGPERERVRERGRGRKRERERERERERDRKRERERDMVGLLAGGQ